jgi:hypothetical protein
MLRTTCMTWYVYTEEGSERPEVRRRARCCAFLTLLHEPMQRRLPRHLRLCSRPRHSSGDQLQQARRLVRRDVVEHQHPPAVEDGHLRNRLLLFLRQVRSRQKRQSYRPYLRSLCGRLLLDASAEKRRVLGREAAEDVAAVVAAPEDGPRAGGDTGKFYLKKCTLCRGADR